MSTPVLPDYVAPFKPVPNVTPFTIRDGATMLKKLDGMKKYIQRVLIPWINENFSELADEFEVQVNSLVMQVNAALAEQSANTDIKISELETFVNTTVDEINALSAADREYVDDAVASIINSTIAVTDPVVTNLLENEATDFSASVNDRIKRQTGILRLDDFDALTDFDTALETAIDIAHTENLEIHGTPNVTYISKRRVARTDKNVIFVGNGCKIVRDPATPTHPILELLYSFTNVQNVSEVSIQTYNDAGTTTVVSRVTVADGAVFAKGDVVKIVSDDPIPWSVPSLNEKIADIFEIYAIDGQYLYTQTPIRVPLVTNIRIAKMTKRNVSLDMNIADDIAAPASMNQPGVIVTGAVDMQLKGRASNMKAEAYQLNSGFRARISVVEGSNIRTSFVDNAFGYLLRENCSVDSIISGGWAQNLRHLYTTGAYDNTDPNSPIFRYGGCINVVVEGGNAGSTGHDAWDTHDDAAFCSFKNVSVRFNHREFGGGQGAIKLRGKANSLISPSTLGIGGIVVEVFDNCGVQLINNHSHQGVEDYTVGNGALQLTGMGVSPGEVIYDNATIYMDKWGGEIIRVNNFIATIPRISFRIRGTRGVNRAFFSQGGGKTYVDDVSLDVSGSTVEARIFTLSDAASEVVAKRVNITARGAAWRLGDFLNVDGKITVEKLSYDTPPAGAIFTNVGAGAVAHVSEIVNAGVSNKDALAMLINGNTTLTVLSADTQMMDIPITNNRVITLPTLGIAYGRTFTIIRTDNATGAFSIDVGGLASLAATGRVVVKYTATGWIVIP